MTQLAEETSTHMHNFSRFEQESSLPAHPWLERLRKSAIARFELTGFPTTHEEEWRHTNVTPIAKIPFRLARPPHEQIGPRFSMPSAIELVFLNGHFAPQLSRLAKIPRAVRVEPLSATLSDNAHLLEPHLARHAQIESKTNPFIALNTGFIRDGAFVQIPRGVMVDAPIHLQFISTTSRDPSVSHPRVLILMEEGSSATIVETYTSAGGEKGPYLTNSVTEIVLGANTHLDHCRLQHESLDAYHLATVAATLGSSANFISHSASIGAALARTDFNVLLAGEFAEATLNGLVIATGAQHIDNHTLLDHQKPNCPSHELYKHVIDGKATGVFKGKIFVQKDAQKTDSKQTSKSLLLSDEATMHSQPALEIYADDVKCTHGSTTGPVDEDQVFYLRSRGVSAEAARHLLTYAFAADITRRIKVEPIRSLLEDFMAAQHGLPQDLRITDLGTAQEAAR
ncbi:MAG TPA: Fe-S cluster assembly protein SufD [Tepidisphaeraceae bacterium]|jgi:Fe-S cluster assembly protein SufD|nr:Fe-S cluster assembly protein SufD [Tepidisphaeraceae bacterium]